MLLPKFSVWVTNSVLKQGYSRSHTPLKFNLVCWHLFCYILVEFVILRNTDLANSKVRTLNLHRANFQLFVPVDEIPWKTVIRDKGFEQRWQLVKDALETKNSSIHMCKKASRKAKKPGWLSKDLLLRLRCKKEMHRQWK